MSTPAMRRANATGQGHRWKHFAAPSSAHLLHPLCAEVCGSCQHGLDQLLSLLSRVVSRACAGVARMNSVQRRQLGPVTVADTRGSQGVRGATHSCHSRAAGGLAGHGERCWRGLGRQPSWTGQGQLVTAEVKLLQGRRATRSGSSVSLGSSLVGAGAQPGAGVAHPSLSPASRHLSLELRRVSRGLEERELEELQEWVTRGAGSRVASCAS